MSHAPSIPKAIRQRVLLQVKTAPGTPVRVVPAPHVVGCGDGALDFEMDPPEAPYSLMRQSAQDGLEVRRRTEASPRRGQPCPVGAGKASQNFPLIRNPQARDRVIERFAAVAEDGLDGEVDSRVCATRDLRPVTALGALKPIGPAHANSSSAVDPKRAHQTGCAQIHTVSGSVAGTRGLAMGISAG